MAKSIHVRYVYDQTQFDTALPLFLRQQFLMVLPIYIIMLVGSVYLLIRGDWLVAVIVFVFALLVFGLFAKLRNDTRRYFALSRAKDRSIDWRISAEKLHVTIDSAESDIRWKSLFAVRETSYGFLILPNRQTFLWLPFASFANGDIDRFRQMAKSSGVRFRRRRQQIRS